MPDCLDRFLQTRHCNFNIAFEIFIQTFKFVCTRFICPMVLGNLYYRLVDYLGVLYYDETKDF